MTHANLMLALMLAFTYFMLGIAASWVEDKPHWRPDLLLWLPNVLYQGAGLLLMRRAAAR
jgi:lipopolysaccharide export system permease protein